MATANVRIDVERYSIEWTERVDGAENFYRFEGPDVTRVLALFQAARGGGPRRDRCAVPPPGWRCTRYAGHDGPCAAVPASSPAAARVDPSHLADAPDLTSAVPGARWVAYWRDFPKLADEAERGGPGLEWRRLNEVQKAEVYEEFPGLTPADLVRYRWLRR